MSDTEEEAHEASKEQEERAAILRRRAVFVASALASLTLPAAASNCEPKPCLEVEPPITVDLPDAGAPTSSAIVRPAPSAPPQPCLEKAPPPPPTVCLEAPF